MSGSLVIINLIPHPTSFLQRRILNALNEDSVHELGIMVKNGRLPHRNASRVTDKAQNYLLLLLELEDLTVTLNQWKVVCNAKFTMLTCSFIISISEAADLESSGANCHRSHGSI